MNTSRRLLPLLLGASLLAPGLAHAAELERAPYLQSATPNSIIVVWTTLDDSTGAVEWGMAPNALDQQASSGSTGTQHEVTLSGLTPSTRYYYRVIGDDEALAGGDELHTFVTPPPVGSRAKMRAWVVGDSGTGGSMQARVRDAMLEEVGAFLPDLYLHMGDMAYTDGTYNEFTENFYAPYADVLRRVPVWPTLGNHEGASSDSGSQTGPYYGGYVLPTAGEAGGLPSGTEAYYSFDYANVHFVVLDSHDSPRGVGGAMLNWLQSDLAATDQEWVVAYWHHPPYTKGSHDSDNEGPLIDMRENALPILEAGGVDLVLGGHSHIYERSYLLDGAYQTPSVAGVGVLDSNDGRPTGDGPYTKGPGLASHEGAIYVVAGHGGTGVSQDDVHPLMAFSEVANGSCMLDVQGNTMTLFNLRHDGQITDRVALIKGDGVVVNTPDGGETLGAGQPHTVTWATAGSIPNVRIEFSEDNGESWSTVEDNIPNNGTYDWTVPAVDTNEALIRVSDARTPAVGDESNAPFSVSTQVPVTVIEYGHTWTYHDEGTDLGDGWHAADYDDSGWKTGPAQLGYGDDDETTALIDADPNYPSAYFRTVIDLPEDGEFIVGEVSALYDDGVAVWVNGQQVFGANVDNGTDYAAWASDSSEDNEIGTTEVDASVFVHGPNVVTAMAKQAGESSSDLSFDLRLVVTTQFPVPPPMGGTSTGGDDGGGDETAGGSASASGGGDATASGPGEGGSGSVATDGGADTLGADDDAGGCSCRSNGNPSPLWMLLVLPFVRRRRDR